MSPQSAIGSTAPGPSTLVCLYRMMRIRWELKRRGFARTFASVRKRCEQRPVTGGDWQATVDAVARRVAAAAAVFPGRAKCLEQSMTLFDALRGLGVPVDLRIGVQPLGFVAHAWVEYNGVPINERGELLRKLVAFGEIRV
jgi:hypothetical protein